MVMVNNVLITIVFQDGEWRMKMIKAVVDSRWPCSTVVKNSE